MNILICGSGILGKALYTQLNSHKNIFVELLSLRQCEFSFFKQKFNNLGEKDIFIDSMDPNDINESFNKSIYEKALMFREYALRNSYKPSFYYLSTSNLYKPSLGFINELSEINSAKSPYLTMKFNNEQLIKDYCKSNFALLRLVNVWQSEASNSFFGDIFYAKSNNLFIKSRPKDELVISYAHVSDVCKIIEYVITKKVFGIINITTNSFNSRENIKAQVNGRSIKSIIKNIGYRIYSNVINYEKVIYKKKELF